MKFPILICLVTVGLTKGAAAASTVATPGPTATSVSLYDCAAPRPEMAGFHNMVLFGRPDDQLYTYHLPLFAGAVNGSSGHVLMHVYQGLWTVQLDTTTKKAYDLSFAKQKTDANPFPFFSIGPQGKRFKVPEMICQPNFSLSAVAVSGHIESNPAFPSPARIVDQLTQVTAREVVFARRFDGSAKPALTYFLFGSGQQQYMVHYLTDDENSFDQIVAVEVLDKNLAMLMSATSGILVTVPVTAENNLVAVTENAGSLSLNNKWKLPAHPLGSNLTVTDPQSGMTGEIKITGEVYFNSNDDLKRK